MTVTQGIEGDDLLWHLRLLGCHNIPRDYYFYPLMDHYNCHDPQWFDLAQTQARSASAVVFYDVLHTGDYEHQKYAELVSRFDHPNKIYLTVNQNPVFWLAGVKIIPWDFMWNRYRAYYLESVSADLSLHHYSRGRYQKISLDFNARRLRKFMSLTGRDYGPRAKLYNIVKDYDGYTTNRSLGITLENRNDLGIFSPPDNQYYRDSYFSIYVESNSVNNQLIHITEKTYEPLTKGHFILPVANPGSISYLRSQGFVFPEFIDYSFDAVDDPIARFDMVLEQFNRLITCNIDQLYKDNRDVLEHNHQQLLARDYDPRILEIFRV